jgi:pilus assembly protein CpaE
MARIVLATGSVELDSLFDQATGGAYLLVPRDDHGDNAEELVGALGAAPLPDVLVIDATRDTDAALRLTRGIRAKYPTISVLLISSDAEAVGLPALRAGALDVVHLGAGVDGFRTALDRAVLSQQTFSDPTATNIETSPLPAPAGEVITVVSPKGGVGKTTVSTSLAVGLASIAPDSTVLVDLDVQFGDVANALNLLPEYSLLDTVRGPASKDTIALKTVLSLHSTGLYAICAPDSPAAADTVTVDEITRLLTMLATQFRYVVVDTAPGMPEHTLAALDRTTDLVLLTSMDVPGVRGLRKEIDLLKELAFDIPRRQVVLNLCDPRGGLSVDDVRTTIGTDIDLQIPVSATALTATNQGVPLIMQSSRDPAVRALRDLVDRFSSAPIGGHRRRSRLLAGSRSR